MSKVFYAGDHIMLMTDYKTPDIHKHLATHMIVSLGGSMEWIVEDEKVICQGICIGSNIRHTGSMPKEGTLVLLFSNVSRLGQSFKKEYLKEQPYTIISETQVDEIRQVYERWKELPKRLDLEIVKLCHLTAKEATGYDLRVEKAIEYLKEAPSIGNDIFKELSQEACLSKCRLSHLFKEETGMSLHSYIALLKLEKTFDYIKKGSSITMASMEAGFDSPSHCAATSKRMFGISIREFHKSLEHSV
ncbi:MAG: AraC family transcriptional regulator [bacterium]|nr:AraC family transcriptional regulator [bacterium]